MDSLSQFSGQTVASHPISLCSPSVNEISPPEVINELNLIVHQELCPTHSICSINSHSTQDIPALLPLQFKDPHEFENWPIQFQANFVGIWIVIKFKVHLGENRSLKIVSCPRYLCHPVHHLSAFPFMSFSKILLFSLYRFFWGLFQVLSSFCHSWWAFADVLFTTAAWWITLKLHGLNYVLVSEI